MAGDEIRVAVVMGGTSTEHDISIMSGINVCNNLPRTRFKTKPVIITKENRWLIHPNWLEANEEFTGVLTGINPMDAGQALSAMLSAKVEAVFLALHGPGGEDGVLQGFFETAGIPHTGSGVLGNAVGMDKILAKQIMLQVGIPTAPFMTIGRRELRKDLRGWIRKAEGSFGYPCVAKVGNQGSSHNMGIAAGREELSNLLETIASAGEYALVEEYIEGREITCAVINKPGAP